MTSTLIDGLTGLLLLPLSFPTWNFFPPSHLFNLPQLRLSLFSFPLLRPPPSVSLSPQTSCLSESGPRIECNSGSWLILVIPRSKPALSALPRPSRVPFPDSRGPWHIPCALPERHCNGRRRSTPPTRVSRYCGVGVQGTERLVNVLRRRLGGFLVVLDGPCLRWSTHRILMSALGGNLPPSPSNPLVASRCFPTVAFCRRPTCRVSSS